MPPYISPQLIALAAAMSYAASGIAAKRGMRYSTPITVTLVSLSIHAAGLWLALLLTSGVPRVGPWVLFLFVVTGTLQDFDSAEIGAFATPVSHLAQATL